MESIRLRFRDEAEEKAATLQYRIYSSYLTFNDNHLFQAISYTGVQTVCGLRKLFKMITSCLYARNTNNN